jgi:hypothetical protein
MSAEVEGPAMWTHSAVDGRHWHSGSRCTPSTWMADGRFVTCRALMVIDPEDAEQVERLNDALSTSCPYGAPHEVVGLRAALREYANPTPRIEEPQGLGAVVEDAAGERWVRHPGMFDRPWFRPDEPSASWRDLPVVRVLSEGVTS